MTTIRSVARWLSAHAAAVMPARRRFWAEGMLHEPEHIENEGAALRWAMGAVFTAYLERATQICGALPVRVLLAFPMLFVATQAAFAQCMTLAWRCHWMRYLDAAGSLTPGDDFRRFVPLMEFVPAWYIAGGIAAAVLILIAVVAHLRGRRSGLVLFVAGVGLSLGIEWLVTLLPGYTAASSRVFGFQDVNAVRDWVIPAAARLLPLCLAVLLWLGSRNPAGKPAQED